MSDEWTDKWGSAAGFIRSIREDIAAGVDEFSKAEMEFALNEMEDCPPSPDVAAVIAAATAEMVGWKVGEPLSCAQFRWVKAIRMAALDALDAAQGKEQR